MRMSLCALILTFAVDPSTAQHADNGPLKVVTEFDVNRYMGTWFEIARLPNPFQGDCAGTTTARYRLLDDGEIEVVNRCELLDGSFKEAKGRARRASADGPPSILEVRFAPAILSFLPFVWGDYWIIDLAPDYRYAVVGEPERKYLWVLGRDPVMDEATFAEIKARAEQQGFDLSTIIRAK